MPRPLTLMFTPRCQSRQGVELYVMATKLDLSCETVHHHVSEFAQQGLLEAREIGGTAALAGATRNGRRRPIVGTPTVR